MKDAFASKRDEYFLNGVIEHHEHRHDPSLQRLSSHPSATFHKTMSPCSHVRALLIAGCKSGPKGPSAQGTL
jgi:hypothetical protein